MQTASVVEDNGLILPPKEHEEEKPETHEQFKVVWPKDLTADIRRLADLSGRSIREASEKLMRWAVERAKSEYEASSERDHGEAKKR